MWICVCEGVGLVFLFALVLVFFFLCVVLSLLEKNFVLMIIIFNDYDDRLEIFKHPYSHSTFIKGYSSFFWVLYIQAKITNSTHCSHKYFAPSLECVAVHATFLLNCICTNHIAQSLHSILFIFLAAQNAAIITSVT